MDDNFSSNVTDLGIIFETITLSFINNEILNPGAKLGFKATAPIELTSPELVDFVTRQQYTSQAGMSFVIIQQKKNYATGNVLLQVHVVLPVDGKSKMKVTL